MLLLSLLRPKQNQPRPVDPRQWAEAFKHTRGDEMPAPRAHVEVPSRKRDKAFIVGS